MARILGGGGGLIWAPLVLDGLNSLPVVPHSSRSFRLMPCVLVLLCCVVLGLVLGVVMLPCQFYARLYVVLCKAISATHSLLTHHDILLASVAVSLPLLATHNEPLQPRLSPVPTILRYLCSMPRLEYLSPCSRNESFL